MEVLETTAFLGILLLAFIISLQVYPAVLRHARSPRANTQWPAELRYRRPERA